MRQERGSVGIEIVNGKFRIRLPRAIFGGVQKYINTSLSDSTANRRKVEIRALLIEDDILSDRFDASLKKYQFTPKTYAPPQKKISLLDLWMQYCDFCQPQVAITTFKQCFRVYTNHIKALPTHDIDEAIAIRDYFLKTLTPRQAKRILIQLNACCKWGVNSRLLTENPFTEILRGLKVKGSSRLIHPFTHEEREAITQAFEIHPDKNYRHYTNFVKFLFLTGCRPGEAIALQWGHISADCTWINFSQSVSLGVRKCTKTGRSRRFPCNGALVELLRQIKPQCINSETQVFTSVKGSTIYSNDFQSRYWWDTVTRLVAEGKVEKYRPPYNCRHTFISHCLNEGISAVQIAKWVGNSPQIIFRHYAGIVENALPPEF